jgi:hypothetical protein
MYLDESKFKNILTVGLEYLHVSKGDNFRRRIKGNFIYILKTQKTELSIVKIYGIKGC